MKFLINIFSEFLIIKDSITGIIKRPAAILPIFSVSLMMVVSPRPEIPTKYLAFDDID